jgi:hypothetical protein
MSGAGAKGPKQRVRVYQDGQATYPAGGIRRKGLVDVDDRLSRMARKVLIGLRVRNNQDILDFKLFGRKGTAKPPIPLTREGASGAIATQLNVVAPAPGEQWIGYIADYDDTLHGKNGFTTELQVSNFTANANGFQEVPVAFTYKDPAGNEFTAGHYLVTTSILPGQNADPEPPPEHAVSGTKSASTAKKKPTTTKAKYAAAGRARAGRRKAAQRKKR